MKKIIIVFVISLIGGFAQAQKLKENEVPKAVKESFTKRFPKAKEVKWSKENETEFEAEFEIDEIEQSVNFDQTGKWLGTETEIKSSQLPAVVQATINKDFAGYKTEEIEKVETPDNGMFYEVELEKDELSYEVKISSDGKILKKIEKKEKGKSKN
ncbi:MAG TPA: PepSY-like domain-containing protein [Cyclobacteriaceae bacterium]